MLGMPDSGTRMIRRRSSCIADLISGDVSASNVIAVATGERRWPDFRRLLDKPEYFVAVRESLAVGPRVSGSTSFRRIRGS